MTKTIFIFLLALTTTHLSAQRVEVQKEVKSAFDSYKEAFENANQGQKTLYFCFQEASSLEDTKDYVSNAEALINRAKRHTRDVIDEVADAKAEAEKIKCEAVIKKLERAEASLAKTEASFASSEDHLALASKKDSVEDMIEGMTNGMKTLQEGQKNLNAAIEQVNGSLKVLKNCKDTAE